MRGYVLTSGRMGLGQGGNMKIQAQLAMVLNLDRCLSCEMHADFRVVPEGGTTENDDGPLAEKARQRYWGGWEPGEGRPRLRAGRPRFLKLFPECAPAVGNLVEKGPLLRFPRTVVHGKLSGHAGLFSLKGKDVFELSASRLAGTEGGAYLRCRQAVLRHLPQACAHCLHPACAAACPSGAIQKRPADGLVLLDAARCANWKYCLESCPYGAALPCPGEDPCPFRSPFIAEGTGKFLLRPCPREAQYAGLLLYDADRVADAASIRDAGELVFAQRGLILNPENPEVVREAVRCGLDRRTLEAAARSPVYKLAIRWELAFPLYPELRTFPMLWYLPPVTPLLESGADDGRDLDVARLAVRYLAALFAAGNERPVRRALRLLLPLRRHAGEARLLSFLLSRRSGYADALLEIGLTSRQIAELHYLLFFATTEDRFVLPRVDEVRSA